MSRPDPSDISDTRAEKVRTVVENDHERIMDADDPWTVLGLGEGASAEEVNAEFERYEQFYRAENFKRFDDKDLTRKALEIRKLVSRAVVELQARNQKGGPSAKSSPSLRSIDPDAHALADIYFRDGISWMKLDDLEAAIDCFQRSMDLDPSSGVTLAYHAYARFRQAPNDGDVVRECRESFRTAAIIEPDDPQVHVLKSRFALQTHNPEMARKGIERVRALEPTHPAIGELRRLYDELTM